MHQTRRSWGSLFHTVRAPAVLLAGTLLVLLLAPESQDMMSGLWDAGLLHGATAYAALLFLGISAWHWSRAALSAHFEVPSNGGRRTLAAAVDPVAFDLVPRLMFLAVVGVGLVLAWRSQGGERPSSPTGGDCHAPSAAATAALPAHGRSVRSRLGCAACRRSYANF
jgi:hypothetical protein